MSSSLSKREVNRQRWSDRIEHWKRSDLTQKAFCEQHQIGFASFQRWRGILAKEGKQKAMPATFLPNQDRGSPMIAHGYLENMRELDVTCSHSRPRVSNDNPFSESQFKTQKYQPDYPGRFDTVSHARHWCEAYFRWYNVEHHHSGLSGFTPEQVFTGRYKALAEQKNSGCLMRAMSKTRNVLSEGVLRSHCLLILLPLIRSGGTLADRVNFPTLTAAGYVSGK